MKWNYAREGCTRGKTARVPLLARCHLHLEFFGHLSASELRFLRVTSRGGVSKIDQKERLLQRGLFSMDTFFNFLLLFLFFFSRLDETRIRKLKVIVILVM